MSIASGLVTPEGKDVGGLAFINKATGKSNLFCFDPLCHHDTESCIAATFYFVGGYIVYNQVANALYCIKPDFNLGGGGTSLYKVDMQASGATLIYAGDANEISRVGTSGKYVFWKHSLPKGGAEICRLDVETNQVDIYPANGKQIGDLRVSGDCVYFTYQDEINHYLTDPAFSETQKLEHFHVGINWEFLSGQTVFYKDQNGALSAMDALTGETREVLNGSLVGVSSTGDTLYFTGSDLARLYRRKADGTGDAEAVYTIDYESMNLPEGTQPFGFSAVWEVSGKLYGWLNIQIAKESSRGTTYDSDAYYVEFVPAENGGYTLRRITAGV